MKIPRVALGLFVLSGCAATQLSRPAPPGAPIAANVPAPTSPAAPARPPHVARSYPERRPEIGITTPMKGEPPPAALAEARLQATTCERATAEEVEGRVRAMRAAVEASFKEWADEQPACWQQMREEWRERQESLARPKYAPRALLDRADAWGGGSLGHGAGIGAIRSADPMSAGGKGAQPPLGPGLGLSGAGVGGGGSGAAGGVADARKPARVAAKAGRASGTNNQVAGVDEADIVKTDGRYVYLAANGALRIVEAMNPRMVSVTKIGGTQVRELFVEGDRAVVYTSNGVPAPRCTYGYDCQFAGDGSATRITVLDVADRARPRVVREIDLSGSLVAARRVGRAVHTVVADNDKQGPSYETWPDDLETCGVPWASARAKFDRLRAANERAIRVRTSAFPTMQEKGKETALCGLLRTPIREPGDRAFTSIVSFDLGDDAAPPSAATLQSRPGAVFASENALYLAVTHHRPASGRWYSYAAGADEVSEIHKFKIGASPRDTKYVGSGTVPGHVLNQFAMDEWYGYLRVATTKGKVPDPKVESVLSILSETPSGNLARIGAIDRIAPGEDIRSVRFDGDRGYVVTFKKTDPLFVMDLFDPRRPAILGELKIPGFSTYIHRIDPEHLLSIGFDANDHGDFAYFDGVILQLFDVKNPTDPRLVHKEKIGTRGSSSEAATNHLAFNWFGSEGLLAVPMTICEGGGDGRNGDQLAFSGLLVYDVDVERGFTRLGGVDHGTRGASCGTWWSNATSHVKRSVFLDDLVYSIASDRVKVQKMSRFGADLASLSLLD